MNIVFHMNHPVVKRLSTGYLHIRWSSDLWFQFPVDREPDISDGFGWVNYEHLRVAKKIYGELI